jgi:hypothetical protein
MKKYFFAICIVAVLSMASGSAQTMGSSGMGFLFPDTLARVTLSGKVSVDTSLALFMYYVDVNGDGKADYYLNFGPMWYAPDSATTVRPKNGDQISLLGGRMNSSMMINGLPMIIVYQLNGKLWRDPFDPIWNDFGMNSHMMGQRMGVCANYAFGPTGTKAQTVSLSGSVLIDTTMFMDRYFLDVTLDGKPDYYLNLGPWWYTSSSGAVRPNNGDKVTIIGGKLPSAIGLPVVLVYEINGKVWRDSTLIGKNFGGGWMRATATNDKVMNPYDEKDLLTMGSGWNIGMGGMMMMSDSLFARMLELNPYNLPNATGQNIFKGYEIGMFNMSGIDGMMQSGGCNGMMSFGASGSIQFHFTDDQVRAYHIDRSTMRVKYWNNLTSQWTMVPNASIDQAMNTITFSNTQIASYYILTSDKVTGVIAGEHVPSGFALDQNFPNPFNPSTTISYTLPEEEFVALKIFDVTGRTLKILDSGRKAAGRHTVMLNADSFSSGVYFYQLNAGPFMEIRKLVLMK